MVFNEKKQDFEDKKQAYRRKNRLWLYGIIALFFLMSLFGYIGFHIASHLGEGALVQANGNRIGGSFRIVSLGGSIVTEGDFRGDYFLVWFVDPRAPKEEIAPILEALDRSLEKLKKEGKFVRPIILSLQTENLDIDDLKDYIMTAAPHIMPFYATQNMVRAMTHLYHAPFEVIEKGTTVPYYKAAPQFVLMDKQDHYVAKIVAEPSEQNIFKNLENALQKDK